MELSQSTVTDAGTAPSPFSRRPPQPKPMPSARIAAANTAPQSAPRAPAMRTAPAVATAPGAIAESVEQQQLARRRRIGARWFYWIAGVSLVNTVVALAGQHWRFIVGLGITQVADELTMRSGHGTAVVALVDAALIGGFVLLGRFALQGRPWAFAGGAAFYALDGLIFLVVRDWVGVAFHAFVVAMTVRGFDAARRLS